VVRLLLLDVSASMFGTSSSGEEHDLDREGGVASFDLDMRRS
jgi:hypothetical protein